MCSRAIPLDAVEAVGAGSAIGIATGRKDIGTLQVSIEDNGGGIRVRSELNKGTVFTVELPG